MNCSHNSVFKNPCFCDGRLSNTGNADGSGNTRWEVETQDIISVIRKKSQTKRNISKSSQNRHDWWILLKRIIWLTCVYAYYSDKINSI